MNDLVAPTVDVSPRKRAVAREKKSLEQEILEAAARLKRLQEMQRENQRRERERNDRGVRELLKSEKLDDFKVEVWAEAVGNIRKTLEDTATRLGGILKLQ